MGKYKIRFGFLQDCSDKVWTVGEWCADVGARTSAGRLMEQWGQETRRPELNQVTIEDRKADVLRTVQEEALRFGDGLNWGDEGERGVKREQ